MTINGTEMISFGAGWNSVAMTIMLVEEGWRGPIVFADTGGEHPQTYCYMQYFERDFLKPHGLEITRLSPATHSDLYDDKRIGKSTLEQYCLEYGIIPQECRRIIERVGLEVPRKSGCFFCPGQRIAEWKNLYFGYPDLYERAITLEENASEHCQKHATLDPHGISLRQHIERGWRGQLQMDLSEWLPCTCRL